MKKKIPKSHIVLLVISMIPLWIHVYNVTEGRQLGHRIFMLVFSSVVLIIGSAFIAVAGSFLMHYTLRFNCWFFNEELKEKPEKEFDDTYNYIGALWPIGFCAVYYFLLKGVC